VEAKLSCYFRHLKEVFESAGIEVTPQNRKSLDAAFHRVVGLNQGLPGNMEATQTGLAV